MVSFKEIIARVKDSFGFNKAELLGLIAAIIATAIIFSFRDWGEDKFDLALGLKSFFLVLLAAGLSFFFRLSCQKIYALSQGYKAEFKVWWAGIIIALVIALISAGRIPLVLIGGVVTVLFVRQRLGEFRYGLSFHENAVISLWGIVGNMILAIFFALGLYFVPHNYFFYKGLILNLIMAFCALLPLPQLDGLQIYFGSRWLYAFLVVAVLLGAVLLITGTRLGLIAAIAMGTIVGIIYILKGSEV
ncbi:MAG: hypothetical protein AB1668_03055 [Nanoarchaeota archaeon]